MASGRNSSRSMDCLTRLCPGASAGRRDCATPIAQHCAAESTVRWSGPRGRVELQLVEMLTRFLFLVVAAGWLGPACAVDSYVVVTVESSLRVPAEIDAFEVRLHDAGARRQLFAPEERFTLAPGESFPFELLFVPADGVSEGDLIVSAIGYLGGAVVAEDVVQTSWKQGRVTRIPPLGL